MSYGRLWWSAGWRHWQGSLRLRRGELSTTVIHAKGAILGTGPELVKEATLVAVNGVIQAVGQRGTISVPPDATNVYYEFDDCHLLPGLVDTHVHLSLPGDGQLPHQFVQARSDLELLLTAERNAERALKAGVTTMRDVGSRGRTIMVLRDAIADGTARGPRLLVSGPPLTITGGHCYYLGGEADGVDGVRQKARAILKDGADLVKVMGSGGGTPGTIGWRPSFSLPEVEAAAEEAHRREARITVHASCHESIETCIHAGVDMLEHAAMWTAAPEGPVHKYHAGLAEMLAERGMYVGPTLQSSYGLIRRLREREEGGDLTQGERAQLDYRLSLFENTMETFSRLHAVGVPLVAGTDAGWDVNPFGREYVTGLELAAEAGMPNWEVVVHATSRAAAAIGLAGQTGALRQGLVADMVLVHGNPLEDISCLRHPTAVFRGGQLVARDDELLA